MKTRITFTLSPRLHSILLLLMICTILSCEKNDCANPSKGITTSPPLKTSISGIKEINSGTTEHLFDVSFPNLRNFSSNLRTNHTVIPITDTIKDKTYKRSKKIGFICGDNGTILKTTDGGNTWVLKNSGTTQYLRRISFLDNKIGFAVGNYATILKTIDGGETWTLKHQDNSTIQPQHLRILHIINATTIYVGGAWGAFYSSTDGGETWQNRNIDNSTTSYDMFFKDPLNGIITGNFARMFKTNNGGVSWTPLYNTIKDSRRTVPQDAIVDLHFIDDQTGFGCLENGKDFNLNKIIKTTDFGETWTELPMPIVPANTVFYDINFLDAQNGFIAMTGGPNNMGGILRTEDGGITWSTFYSLNNNLNRAFFANDTIAFFVGDNGKILMGN